MGPPGVNTSSVRDALRSTIRGDTGMSRLGDLVPVAKGNGYGQGLRRLAAEATRLGVDRLAVGTVFEIAEVAEAFHGEILLMSPGIRATPLPLPLARYRLLGCRCPSHPHHLGRRDGQADAAGTAPGQSHRDRGHHQHAPVRDARERTAVCRRRAGDAIGTGAGSPAHRGPRVAPAAGNARGPPRIGDETPARHEYQSDQYKGGPRPGRQRSRRRCGPRCPCPRTPTRCGSRT